MDSTLVTGPVENNLSLNHSIRGFRQIGGSPESLVAGAIERDIETASGISKTKGEHQKGFELGLPKSNLLTKILEHRDSINPSTRRKRPVK